MGYTTDFEGSLTIKKPLTQKQTKYINALCQTRRMRRNVNKLMEIYKGKHGNPFAKDKTDAQEVYGREGEFFAYDDGRFGQDQCPSIIDYNLSPGQCDFLRNSNVQPGLWCGWCITEDGEELEWNGGEKFYNYIAWLRYLINEFFIPWGRKLNGEILWYGEDREDIGKIVVENNEIKTVLGELKYDDDE